MEKYNTAIHCRDCDHKQAEVTSYESKVEEYYKANFKCEKCGSTRFYAKSIPLKEATSIPRFETPKPKDYSQEKIAILRELALWFRVIASNPNFRTS